MKLLSLARDLQRRKARDRQHRFVAEGVRTVEALLASGLPVEGMLVTAILRDQARGRQLVEVADGRGIAVVEVSDEELESAAGTETPQGVLAVAPIPERSLRAPEGPSSRFLVLDALQDPGNVGTVIRTAAALGVTATVALPGTVDLWNAKVVRSTMGALFVHPALPMSWDAFAEFAASHSVPVWAADTDGVPLDQVAADSLPAHLALVVSNEGAGLSAHVAAAVTSRVAIRMAPGIESLNVAVAAGILLHALRVG
ncbi:TrmH family RNA methyltransferase [Gemmatimonas sp.]|uniref:TrmH family RNA methyltransferase n=1 Tax=Gemmatimonas sp. TaxID=1962908 RepID=UPI003982E4F0